MKTSKAIIAGILVWVCIVISFLILGFIPALKHSLHAQTLIVTVLVIPFATFGASFYYKSGNTATGLKLGIVMSLTALILDAFITVPFIEMPNGGNYLTFYSYPLLWLLVAVNMLTIYIYHRRTFKEAAIQ